MGVGIENLTESRKTILGDNQPPRISQLCHQLMPLPLNQSLVLFQSYLYYIILNHFVFVILKARRPFAFVHKMKEKCICAIIKYKICCKI